jgi:hypothetical protein
VQNFALDFALTSQKLNAKKSFAHTLFSEKVKHRLKRRVDTRLKRKDDGKNIILEPAISQFNNKKTGVRLSHSGNFHNLNNK